MAEMKIQRTTITEIGAEQSQVEIVLADQADIADASEYVTMKVTVPHPEEPLLVEVKLEAIRRARGAIGDQTQAFSERSGRAR